MSDNVTTLFLFLLCSTVGGEKRRCTVAHELLIDPSLLLLDEPTSGLDSTSAMRMFRTMQALARSGRTVIASVHQPSSRGYQLLDKVGLICSMHLKLFKICWVLRIIGIGVVVQATNH